MNDIQTLQAQINTALRSVSAPLAIVLEGRDGAGKTGAIRQATEYLPFSQYRIIHSRKPNNSAMANWLPYWTHQLPEKMGQIFFFDRSWYSRALVQKINGWCSDMQYRNFMEKVEAWESNKGVNFVKFWLSISEDEQAQRIEERRISPLKYWKLSPNDERALSYYDEMTLLKERVVSRGGWQTVDFNNKANGRLELLTRLNTLLGPAS